MVHDAGGQSCVVGHWILLHNIKGGMVDDFIQNFLCYVFLQELQYFLNFPLWVLYAEFHKNSFELCMSYDFVCGQNI